MSHRSEKPWAKGERFARTARFRVAAPAAEVFPLLCPVREHEWIPDWSCVDYDPPTRIDFLLTFGAKACVRLELELADDGDGCDFSWTMRFTAASRLMSALLRRRMSEKSFADMAADRKRQLADYFKRRR